ncbi:MAG: efflux RND transporter permease subunit, partial [Alphaproteobacteria bacterium]
TRLVIAARYPVLAGAVAVLAGQAALLIDGSVRFRFFDAPERTDVTANFAMAPGATRQDTLAQLALVEQAVTDYGAELEGKYGTNPVVHVLGQIGGNAGRSLASAEDKEPDQLGAVSIELIDADLRPYSSFTFVSELQARVPRLPQLEELSFRGGRFGPGGDALDVEITGAPAEVLKAAAEALKSQLSQYPEVSALEDDLTYDREEWSLELTPQGKALGFSIDALGRELRNRLGGIEAATYPDGMRTAAIRVELPADEITTDFVERMMVRTSTGNYVPLSDLVTVTTRSGFATVIRKDGQRVVTVTGDIDQSDPVRADEIRQALEAEILPQLAETHGVSFRLSGLARQQREFLSDAALGMGLALLGIFLTLAWIFASWTRPLVVMAIIPFGLVGAVWGHAHWGIPMSMFSVVGLIGMSGIIINDSIVLIATIDEYARTRGLRAAIVDAVSDRLRPVFLTTATTVIGLAPLLYERSSQAQFLKPTVITLVYGLGFGFVLVLLVVPALVAMQDDLGRQMRALRRALSGRRARVRGASALVWVALGAMALAFIPTVGWRLATGHGAPLPGLESLAGGIPAAAGAFIGASALIALVALAIGAFLVRRPAPARRG